MRNKYRRRWSLFERNGKRWKRITELAYPKDIAIRVFQNRLLDSVLNGTKECRLRPID